MCGFYFGGLKFVVDVELVIKWVGEEGRLWGGGRSGGGLRMRYWEEF